MGVGGGSRVGRLGWPLGVVAAVASLLGALWLLGWRGAPPEAGSTIPTVTAAPSSPSTTAPEDLDGRVDIMGVVVAVEPGPGWEIPATGDCPDPGQGPHPEDCPRIGPATLILSTGTRLEVPADTPGDPVLWDLAHLGAGTAEAFVIAGLRDEWTVSWVYVLEAGDLPHMVDLAAGALTSIAADGWAETDTGWSYRLETTLRTRGCSHLLPWTLEGPRSSGRAEWITRRELVAAWDGPQGTRLDLPPAGPATTRIVGALICTDLLDQRGDPDPLATLESARALWASHQVHDYCFRYSFGDSERSGGTWDITVVAGEATAEMVEPPEGHSPRFELVTIDDLFSMIPADPGDDAAWSATYDPTWGYPSQFTYDDPGSVDVEQWWRVESFEQL